MSIEAFVREDYRVTISFGGFVAFGAILQSVYSAREDQMHLRECFRHVGIDAEVRVEEKCENGLWVVVEDDL